MTDSERLPVQVENRPQQAPAPSRPRSPLARLRSDVERIFDDFTPMLWGHPLSALRIPSEALDVVAPAVDIAETPERFELTAEMPGMKADNVEVRISNRTLIIRGEKEEKSEQRDRQLYVSERRYGSVKRSFELPAEVDKEKIEARFENGVLTVVLPKTESARQNERKIEIKAA